MRCVMSLNEFLLSVQIGWPHEERKRHQLIAVNITLAFSSPPKACETDELADTLCYHGLSDALKAGIKDRGFRLIECLAATLYQIIRDFVANDTIAIQVKVTKKPAIADLTEGVTFSYGDLA